MQTFKYQLKGSVKAEMLLVGLLLRRVWLKDEGKFTYLYIRDVYDLRHNY
jgi:hypothetical protein